MLFDFIVEELAKRELEDLRRIRPLRVALQNQRDDLLAFAGVLDAELADIAQAHVIPELLVRDACVLHRLPSTSTAYWQGWNRLRAKLGDKIPPAVRRRRSGYGANTAQQFAGREPQFTAAQLLHAAPSPGWYYVGLLRFFIGASCATGVPNGTAKARGN
jgi:acyl-CoA synthetase (AMP-forming)/AMP-acid ligase II